MMVEMCYCTTGSLGKGDWSLSYFDRNLSVENEIVRALSWLNLSGCAQWKQELEESNLNSGQSSWSNIEDKCEIKQAQWWNNSFRASNRQQRNLITWLAERGLFTVSSSEGCDLEMFSAPEEALKLCTRRHTFTQKVLILSPRWHACHGWCLYVFNLTKEWFPSGLCVLPMSS